MVAERMGFCLPERFQGVCDRKTGRIRVCCVHLIGAGGWHNVNWKNELTEVKKKNRGMVDLMAIISTLFFILTNFSQPATAVEFPSGTTPPFHHCQSRPLINIFLSAC